MFQQGVTLKELLENPELLNPPKRADQVSGDEKKKDAGSGSSGQGMFAGQSAFLGPNIWDKTVPYTEDFNLEYMDLDEFLLENCIDDSKSPGTTTPQTPPQLSPQPHGALNLSPMHSATSPLPQLSPVLSPPAPESPQVQQPRQQTELAKFLSPSPPQASMTPLTPSTPSESPTNAAATAGSSGTIMDRRKVTCSESESSEDYTSLFTPNNLALGQGEGQEEFDPRKRAFSEDELRPQPMIKKSRKVYVPDDMKDDKYWLRRKKNNTAAKRSRDARRVKENQIALRAAFLEKEASDLREELEATKEENQKLREELSKYKNKD